MVPSERALGSSHRLHPYRLFLYQHSFARNFRLEFWVGVANLQSWGRGSRRGRGDTVRKSFGEFLYALHSNLSSIFAAFQRYCRFCAPACHVFPPHI